MRPVIFCLFSAVLIYTVTGKFCDESQCKRPSCVCDTQGSPEGLRVEDTPQFVMLTFDDAVNVVNFPDYEELLMNGRKNLRSNCPIQATFFVSHEYTDYSLVHELWRYNNDIGVHSISHLPSTEYWKNANQTIWEEELGGIRKIISKFANIPESDIVGVRAPFLQTAGDVTFGVMKSLDFHYDSSMPTRQKANPPLWPYTMDYGYQQDCQITPCPTKNYKSFFIVPMVNYFRKLEIAPGHFLDIPCAMADACLPLPETEDETFQYLRENFERHYSTNRAPFPLFLHQAWFSNPERKKGYFKFVDWLLQKDDVFIVTIREALEFVRNPQPLDNYKQVCKSPKQSTCVSNQCTYSKTPLNGPRNMKCCGTCPANYPWLWNVEGN